MMPRRLGARRDDASGVGVEPRLRRAAEAVRLDAGPLASLLVTSGLLFLKFLSDAFDDRQMDLATFGAAAGAGLTVHDADVLRELRMPRQAFWADVVAEVGRHAFAAHLTDAMAAVERHNPWLADVLPSEHLRGRLNPVPLREFAELLSRANLGRANPGLGARLFDALLSTFAVVAREYGPTPRSVSRALVEMLAPRDGSLYDPCCGSGGLLVDAATLTSAAGARSSLRKLHGQELVVDAWRLARINLTLHGLDGEIALGDSLGDAAHPGLRADYVVADPPFSATGGRGRVGSFTWLQHIVHHLAPAGLAGVVLPRAAMWSTADGAGEIRRGILEADLVDCVVALPGRLYRSTSIPVSVWLLAKDKSDPRFRNRRGRTLFIDARDLGATRGRGPRELGEHEIARLSRTYHAWRGGEEEVATYCETPGFSRDASLEEIRARDHVLTPEDYVGTPAKSVEAEPFERRLQRLSDTLDAQFTQAAQLEQAIRHTLARLRVSQEE